MKFKTKKAALCHELLNGATLSIMDGFKKIGITNLPREISRLIEGDFGVQVLRTKNIVKSKYGHTYTYNQYKLVQHLGHIHIAFMPFGIRKRHYEGIAKMKEYVLGNTVKR